MFKNKYISLLLLWSLGLFMLIYLFIPLMSGKNENPTTESSFNTMNNISNNSEAYVIVTIDEKHFLTRFVSYLPETGSVPIPGKPKTQVTNGRNVERVLIRAKPAKGRKTEDFTIKPAPLE